MIQPMNLGRISRPFKTTKRTASTVAVTALVLTALTGTSRADSGDSQQEFTLRAQNLGLTRPQANALQERVESYLAKNGGVQVEINKINYDDGKSLVVPLPGEKKVREINAQTKSIKSSSADIVCEEGNFCAWSGTDYTGTQWNLYHCRDYSMPPGWTYGSWWNNQTGRAQALFKDKQKIIRWISDPAPTSDQYAPWDWVGWIKPC
ncbi:peptidase inhibitor family I36 protein [Streptomyces sp. 2A115]|uniref:peptidase inhibitor family I36 protein n=1 Tax=Streptomyces sp. 2A115 TaxID=3457439 RepID=UPI003FD1D463